MDARGRGTGGLLPLPSCLSCLLSAINQTTSPRTKAATDADDPQLSPPGAEQLGRGQTCDQRAKAAHGAHVSEDLASRANVGTYPQRLATHLGFDLLARRLEEQREKRQESWAPCRVVLLEEEARVVW